MEVEFTVDDLRERYSCKSDTELAGLLDASKGTISLWRKNGVPAGYQRILRLESKIHGSRKKTPFNRLKTLLTI